MTMTSQKQQAALASPAAAVLAAEVVVVAEVVLEGLSATMNGSVAIGQLVQMDGRQENAILQKSRSMCRMKNAKTKQKFQLQHKNAKLKIQSRLKYHYQQIKLTRY